MDAVEIPLPAKVDFGKILITSAADGVDGGGEVVRRCADADRRNGGNDLFLRLFVSFGCACSVLVGVSVLWSKSFHLLPILFLFCFGIYFSVIFCCRCDIGGDAGVVCWVSR